MNEGETSAEPQPTAPARPYSKPLPDPTAASKPYWDGLRERKVMLQRSRKTGKFIFYPRIVSPFGRADELEWVEASGLGTVYSYTVARRPTAPHWADDGAYVIAIVELTEGPHITANIVGCDPDSVRSGMAVIADFVPATDEVTLLQFRPASQAPEAPPPGDLATPTE